LTENLPEDERARQFSAIHAISNMYREKTREILNEKLSDIILNKVVDDNWDKVIIYLGKINIWDYLTESCQIKGVAFIKKLKLFEKEWYGQSASDEHLDILLIANRIFFLKEAVKTKLQLPLNKLLIVKKYYKNQSQFYLINETIEPLLETAIPQANFDELLLMRSEESCLLNDKIEPYLIEKIKEVSLEDLLEGFLNIQRDEELLYKSLEKRLKLILNNINLDELLENRGNYTRYLSRKRQGDVIKMLDESVIQLFEKASFDDLIDIESKYHDELFEKRFRPLLKDNTSKIVKKFKLSSSFADAASNANLLNEAADFISLAQWKEVLEAFVQNDQIYNSHGCASTFEFLFQKSIEIDNSVKPYWLSFREKLNSFGIHNRYLNSLKNLIDSQLELE
jgi:hypothetical protein